MKDVQSQPDHRMIDIQKVGIKGIKYPINVLDRANKLQATVATVNMYVHLPHKFKGTHMSRFVEVLNEHHGDFQLQTFFAMLDKIKASLDAHAANLEVSFPYFMKKIAPVSHVPSMMEYTCKYVGAVDGNREQLFIGVQVPVCTVCPCSKEISLEGAHNQRGVVSVTILFTDFFWIEEIIEIVEGSASSDVFALLKREDEKYITERAYRHPMFVEDVVREVARKLKADPRFTWFSVEAENYESIHNHSAYAYTEVGTT